MGNKWPYYSRDDNGYGVNLDGRRLARDRQGCVTGKICTSSPGSGVQGLLADCARRSGCFLASWKLKLLLGGNGRGSDGQVVRSGPDGGRCFRFDRGAGGGPRAAPGREVRGGSV